MFGSLIKGMHVGIELLMLMKEHEVLNSLLSKVVSIPILSGSEGLQKFLSQFHAAIDSDFPDYQVSTASSCSLHIIILCLL